MKNLIKRMLQGIKGFFTTYSRDKVIWTIAIPLAIGWSFAAICLNIAAIRVLANVGAGCIIWWIAFFICELIEKRLNRKKIAQEMAELRKEMREDRHFLLRVRAELAKDKDRPKLH
jgi:hypothetical protein